MISRAPAFKLLWLGALLLLLFIVNLATGSIHIPVENLLQAAFGLEGDEREILLRFRLPKALTCVLAGAALSVGGLLMQTLFRNPLAGPDVLGLSSGSSLMVAIVIMTGQATGVFLFGNPWLVAIAATAGAALVFALVLMIARLVKDNTSLLIIGLMISAAAASLVGVIQFMSRAEDLQAFMIWGLGSVGGTSGYEIFVLFVVMIAGSMMSLSQMKALNGLLLGENYATSIGIRVSAARLWILTATCLLTGGVTAFCGPIAFVGLAVPHLVRMIIPTTSHKIMIPAVMAGGASLMLLCDIIAQMPGSAQVLPLNAVTSLIGAPVVIWLIIRGKRLRM
jgi:iron complex transport system permease protein